MAMSGRSVGLIGPGKCSQRIGLHVVSGCDTVSYRFRKGKNSALKLLEIEISRLDQVFGQPGTIGSMRRQTACYYGSVPKRAEQQLMTLRARVFCGRRITPPLQKLPPNDGNLQLHVLRSV